MDRAKRYRSDAKRHLILAWMWGVSVAVDAVVAGIYLERGEWFGWMWLVIAVTAGAVAALNVSTWKNLLLAAVYTEEMDRWM